MMKGFFKSGKFIGLALIAMGLVFAGCLGAPSGEEEAVSPSAQNRHAVPIVLDPSADGGPTMIIGDGDGMAAPFQTADGHTVQLTMGSTACALQGGDPNETLCWVRLSNLDPDEYAANAYINIDSCPTCTTAVMDNSDKSGGAVCPVTEAVGDPDCGASQAVAGSGFCYAEDGNFDPSTGAAEPWNQGGCKTIQGSYNGKKEPVQILHPDCGVRGVAWDFGGQSVKYKFYASVSADWFPWGNPAADGRIDSTNRSTYYIMITDLNDDPLAGAAAFRRQWWREGSYIRSNVLAGYGAGTNKATLANGRIFGVNIAVEAPDRVEAYKMGDKWNFTPYEYYNQITSVLRWNPNTVTLLTSTSSTPGGTPLTTGGGLDICKNGCTGNNKPSWLYFGAGGDNVTGAADGWVATFRSMASSQAFNYFAAGGNYQTTFAGKANVYYSGAMPMHMGQLGFAHFNVPYGSVVSWFTSAFSGGNAASSVLVHEGVDADPEIPYRMYYFQVTGNSGDGSEFWIDTFADWSFFEWMYTKSNLVPGGKAGAPPNDWIGYCWPIDLASYNNDTDRGCPPTQPDASTIVFKDGERSNYNILQGGESAKGYQTGGGANIRGGVQQWAVHLCVQ